MAQQVIVMQGLSGSGKSTLARRYTEAFRAAGGASVTVSADDFFMRLGGGTRYAFDPARLGEAHASCFRSFMDALLGGTELIIVDNTNTSAIEIAPYMAAAAAYGAAARVVRVECDVTVAATRNSHGVPLAAVEAMARRMAESLPPWWLVETVDNRASA